MTDATLTPALSARLAAAAAHLSTLEWVDLGLDDGLNGALTAVRHPEQGHALASLSRGALQFADDSINSPYDIVEENGVYLLPLDEEKVERGQMVGATPVHYIFFNSRGEALWGPDLGQVGDGEQRMLLAGQSVTLMRENDLTDAVDGGDAASLFESAEAFWYDLLDAGRKDPDGWLVNTSEEDTPGIL